MLESIKGFMFTIESSMDITPEEVIRSIEHRFYLDNAFTIKKCNNKKLRLFLMDKQPMIEKMTLFEYRKEQYEFIKQILLTEINLDQWFPMNRYVTRTNPYSTEPRPTSSNFNQDLITFNNVDIKISIDLPFQICSSYFSSSCCLHESLVCINNDHEYNHCEAHAISTLLDIIHECFPNVKVDSIEYCLINTYNRE